MLACPIGRIKKNLSPNKAQEHYMLFSYWKFYFRQIPIDSTSAGVEYRLFVDDGGGIYAVFCECVESTFFTSRH